MFTKNTAAKSDKLDKKDLFENVPIKRALLTMAVPTVISQLINLIYNLVDTFYIGRTGDSYKTAAVTLAFTVFMLTQAIANLFGIGGGSLMSRLAGAGEHKKAKGVCAAGFWGSVLAAAAYSLLVGAFLDPILKMLGASENTLEFARQYTLIVVVAGNLPTILSTVASHLVRNAGYSKHASIGLSLGGVLNIILDPLFMFVLLPEGYEIVGAALATLISNIVSCVYLVAVLAVLSKKTILSVNPRGIKEIKKAEWKSFFAVGIPSAMLTGLFDLANIVLNSLMAGHGDLELAAIGIVMKAERLPNAVNLGVCQGMLPIVAYNYASGNHERMNKAVKTARVWGIVISLATVILYEIFSKPICEVFLSVGENNVNAVKTIAFAAVFLRIRCLASLPQFLNYNTSYCMQAVGYGSGTLIHACVRELVFYIPLMYLFNALAGVYGLVSAIVIGESLGGIFALLLFKVWKKKNLALGGGSI